jgi:S1-C subfamily serine protease
MIRDQSTNWIPSLLVAVAIVTTVAIIVLMSELGTQMVYQTRELPGLTIAQTLHPKRQLIVTSLQSSGPAKAAGIRVGDNVIAINQRPVSTINEVRSILKRDAAEQVKLRFNHNRISKDINLMRAGKETHGS